MTISIFKESTSILKNSLIFFQVMYIIPVVFNEVVTKYVHLPWTEYTPHSNKFHLMFHFFLHRQSKEKEKGKKEFF